MLYNFFCLDCGFMGEWCESFEKANLARQCNIFVEFWYHHTFHIHHTTRVRDVFVANGEFSCSSIEIANKSSQSCVALSSKQPFLRQFRNGHHCRHHHRHHYCHYLISFPSSLLLLVLPRWHHCQYLRSFHLHDSQSGVAQQCYVCPFFGLGKRWNWYSARWHDHGVKMWPTFKS